MEFEITKRLIFTEARRLLNEREKFANSDDGLSLYNYSIFSAALSKLSNEYECIFNSNLNKDLEYDRLERMAEEWIGYEE